MGWGLSRFSNRKETRVHLESDLISCSAVHRVRGGGVPGGALHPNLSSPNREQKHLHYVVQHFGYTCIKRAFSTQVTIYHRFFNTEVVVHACTGALLAAAPAARVPEVT